MGPGDARALAPAALSRTHSPPEVFDGRLAQGGQDLVRRLRERGSGGRQLQGEVKVQALGGRVGGHFVFFLGAAQERRRRQGACVCRVCCRFLWPWSVSRGDSGRRAGSAETHRRGGRGRGAREENVCELTFFVFLRRGGAAWGRGRALPYSRVFCPDPPAASAPAASPLLPTQPTLHIRGAGLHHAPHLFRCSGHHPARRPPRDRPWRPVISLRRVLQTFFVSSFKKYSQKTRS